MAEKHTVAMFVTDANGNRTQVGWASPKDESGVRTFEYTPGYEHTRPKNVSFEDDELSQKVAEEQAESAPGDDEFEIEVNPDATDWNASEDTNLNDSPVEAFDDNSFSVVGSAPEDYPDSTPRVDASPDSSQDAERVEDAPNAEQTDELTDSDGFFDEPVELSSGGAIVEVSNEDEEAEFERLLAEEKAETENQEQPLTRRDLRENEDN